MKLKHFLAALLLVAAINLSPAIVHAQTSPGGYDSNDADDPVNVPFDGGVSLLVAASIAYGLKSKHDSKKQLEEE